jgi:hypothetical protein
MKKIITLLFLVMLVSAFSIDAMGMQNSRPKIRHNNGQNNNGHNNGGGSNGSVGAPLDGGLLVVLGAAGVAYVAARRKKKD